MSRKRCRVLFVCSANRCRSPMAASILREFARERGLEGIIQADSAGVLDAYAYAGFGADKGSREAIRKMYGRDLLCDHRSKGISGVNLDDCDLIITMEEWHKHRLPEGKTRTLKEFAGEKGDIEDPFGKGQEFYDACCSELRGHIERVLGKITGHS